jgi:hypothetical protein
MPKVYDAQGHYLHDAEPMPPEFIAPPADPTPTPPTIEAKIDAVIAAVTALVDDRHADAVDALAAVMTEGTPT